MHASASNKTDTADKLLRIFVNFKKPIPSEVQCNKPAVKYTRVPDFDLRLKETCSEQCVALEPRVRRIIAIDKPKEYTNRSLKSNVELAVKMASKICSQKIVTIEEDDKIINVQHKLCGPCQSYTKSFTQVTDTDLNEERKTSQNISRLSNVPKYSKLTKSNAKTNLTNNKKESTTPKFEHRCKYIRGDRPPLKTIKSKESNDESNRSILSKKLMNSKEKDYITKKSKMKAEGILKPTPKPDVERTRRSKSPGNIHQNKMSFIKETNRKKNPGSMKRVTLDNKLEKCDVGTISFGNLLYDDFVDDQEVYSMQTMQIIDLKDVQVNTIPAEKIDQMTSTDKELIKKTDSESNVKESFDSLEIPNVSLTNCKTDISKEEIVNVISNESIHNLDISPRNVEENLTDTVYHKNTSVIIGEATLTCTTRQKINFQVVENNEVLHSRISPGSYKYPLNVVSVLKKQLSNEAYKNSEKLDYNGKDDNSKDEKEHLNRLTSINCSYVFNNDKLVKPSDIISTIKVNNSLLHADYLCGQFQRELNFIDSFFESLQYLENCSISDKCIIEKKVENWISSTGHELKNLEFGSFLTQYENEFNIDSTKTMASESLCLLNLLIQDEQIRAENLLDVLKMREDALKDFTKSQILWLEDKKKQENTDISTLKKKQRGALLKLQHECGEMQRMRKALLTLSEQRKVALKKTKKNIEWKLKNSSDVQQIILGKKKLKRNISADRNVAPLKCFELSSSGCDDSTTSRTKSNASILFSNDLKITTSAEKWVQTGDSLPVTSDQATNTSDENFVVVHGSYLNILFHNLSLPQIFSPGKQYEVNREALKNMIHTTNMHNVTMDNDFVLGEFMEQIKNHELDSSSPSTARSLLEEFNQIYKGFSDEDAVPHEVINHESVKEVKDVEVITDLETVKSIQKSKGVQSENVLTDQSISVPVDKCCSCEPSSTSIGIQSCKKSNNRVTQTSVTGPLPIPAGAAASDDVPTEVATWLSQKSSIDSLDETCSSNAPQRDCVAILPPPVLYEAEELLRQQLAIEKEIIALEQQQSQLLAVREIPDKPPPPYTPPTETRVSKPPNFTIDDITGKVNKLLNQIKEPDSSDVFDIFVKDYCQESIERQKLCSSEKYWDNYETVSVKPKPESDKLTKKAAADLKEVLKGVPPTNVSGVGARRSDHIDDILFAEWRRCEPEWTSLHTDEVTVKNQVFESIFQKILTETIDKYTKIVLTKSDSGAELSSTSVKS